MYNRPAAGRASVIVGSLPSTVRGQHVFKEFWTLEVGEKLACQCKEDNPNDMYVVAVKTDAGIIVGRLLRKIGSLFVPAMRQEWYDQPN